MKYFRLMLVALALMLLNAGQVFACSVCQGDPDSEMTQGAKAGVIVMVVVTYVLLFAVGGLVASWIVRARRMGQAI